MPLQSIVDEILGLEAGEGGATLRGLINGFWFDQEDHNTIPFVRFHLITARPEYVFDEAGSPRADDDALIQFSIFAASQVKAAAIYTALIGLYDNALLTGSDGILHMVREEQVLNWDEGAWHYSVDYRCSLELTGD